MNDQTNEADVDEPPPRSMQRAWIVLLVIAAALLAGAAALILISRDDEPAEPAALRIGWAIADGESLAATVTLSVDPASEGKNTIGVDIDPEAGSVFTTVEDVQIRLLPLRGDGEQISLSVALDDRQSGSATVDLAGSDQWEAQVSSSDGVLATFFLLIPDPNLFGDNAIPVLGDDPDALALYQQASANIAAWQRVRYEQQMSNGDGLALISFREINDGSDGSPAGFRYFTPGGLEAVVLGTTAWSRYPGEVWEVRTTNAMIPPSEWGGEYLGATGFQLGPVADSPAGPCRIITFVVPESDRQAIAWYAWCIDEATGQVQRESMISRAHYMITEFSDVDGEILVEPPAGAPGTPEASPVSVRQESLN
ncbi:MAG: hypothetical protein KF883_13290 [Thermomicrobiales bacterium]|nr:hypothetical protein [Thermomicrobiales bacterium]